MKITYILPLLLLLISCSTASPDQAPENFTPASEKGLAVGTITFEGEVPKNDLYRFFYSPTSGDKKFVKQNKGKIQIVGRVNDVRGYNGDFNNKKSYLFVIEKEPGNYAFTDYNYLTHKGATGMVNSSRKFAIPFEVKKGEINYIGEITYIENAEPGTPRIIVSDNMGRDAEEFRKKFPRVSWDLTVNKTAKSGDTGGGIVDFR